MYQDCAKYGGYCKIWSLLSGSRCRGNNRHPASHSCDWCHNITLGVGAEWWEYKATHSLWVGEGPGRLHIGASIGDEAFWVSRHLPGILGRKNNTNKSTIIYFLFLSSEVFCYKILDTKNILKKIICLILTLLHSPILCSVQCKISNDSPFDSY